MRINVRVRTGCRGQEILKEADFYRVKLLAVPEKGKANEELVKLLADYFNMPKSKIRIFRGFKSPDKVIELVD